MRKRNPLLFHHKKRLGDDFSAFFALQGVWGGIMNCLSMRIIVEGILCCQEILIAAMLCFHVFRRPLWIVRGFSGIVNIAIL